MSAFKFRGGPNWAFAEPGPWQGSTRCGSLHTSRDLQESVVIGDHDHRQHHHHRHRHTPESAGSITCSSGHHLDSFYSPSPLGSMFICCARAGLLSGLLGLFLFCLGFSRLRVPGYRMHLAVFRTVWGSEGEVCKCRAATNRG